MSGKFSQCDRTDRIAKGLIRLGWTTASRNKHVRLVDPEGKKHVTVAHTPSDGRAVLNWISQLRREGIDVDAILAPKKSKGRHT